MKIALQRKKRRFFIHALLVLTSCAVIALSIYVIILNTRATSQDTRFSDLKGFCQNLSKFTNDDFNLRLNNLKQKLIQSNYTTYVVETGASMSYFTNIYWGISERPFLFVLSIVDPLVSTILPTEIFWISPAFEVARAREKVGNSTIIYWQEDENYALKLINYIQQLTSINITIAVDPELRSFITDGITQIAKTITNQTVTVVNGVNAVSACRMVKSNKELAYLNCVNTATKNAIKSVAAYITIGSTESDIKTLLQLAQSTAGLSNIWYLVLIDQNAAFPHGTSNEGVVNSDSIILIDTGGNYGGYQSDVTRTFKLQNGVLSTNKSDVWNIVKQAQMAALNIIKPGVACGDVDKAARDVVIQAGYGPDYAYFTHRLGHGIGLQGHEWPYLVKNNTQTLAEGMTFSVEPGIYIPGYFGVRLEDIVQVTSDGYAVFGPISNSLDDPFGN